MDTTAEITNVIRDDVNRLISIEWNNGNRRQDRYPYVWLRDNCLCGECHNSTSNSRRMLMADLDTKVGCDEIKIENGGAGLKIKWSNGHVSAFDSNWLRPRSFDQEVQRKRLKDYYFLDKHLWGAEMAGKLPTADFQQIMNDDRAFYDFLSTLCTLGIIIVKNAPKEYGQVMKICKRVAFHRECNFGPTFCVKSRPDPTNLSYTGLALGFHTDISYYNYVPGVQLLHCIEQCQCTGGSNVFVDGFRVAKQLRENQPAVYQTLCNTPIDYYCLGEDAYEYHMAGRHSIIVENRWTGEPEAIYDNNHGRAYISHVPVEQVQGLYDALKVWNSSLYHPNNMIEYKMESGDIAVFDNTRILHGRNAYNSASGSRQLEGGYFEWDEAWSRVRVLMGKLGIDKEKLLISEK